MIHKYVHRWEREKTYEHTGQDLPSMTAERGTVCRASSQKGPAGVHLAAVWSVAQDYLRLPEVSSTWLPSSEPEPPGQFPLLKVDWRRRPTWLTGPELGVDLVTLLPGARSVRPPNGRAKCSRNWSADGLGSPYPSPHVELFPNT